MASFHSKGKKVTENLYDQLPEYGSGRRHSNNWWKALGTILLNNGFLVESVRATYRTISYAICGDQILRILAKTRPSTTDRLILVDRVNMVAILSISDE
ncbi:hypothetical protein HU200_012511 [Digitaria exilis]|uniref:RQC domain-containing protein n=1 Tax=Digitaria exilis TaxID=1010633 RepID=A0A835FFH6_9POAL|nr:hypothetical protein HU200_012511 [Digitaria exilis]